MVDRHHESPLANVCGTAPQPTLGFLDDSSSTGTLLMIGDGIVVILLVASVLVTKSDGSLGSRSWWVHVAAGRIIHSSSRLNMRSMPND